MEREIGVIFLLLPSCLTVGLEVTARPYRSFNGQSSPISISHQALEPPPVFSRLDLGVATLFYFCEC